MGNLQLFISKSNVGTHPQLKLLLLGMTNTGYRRGIKLIRMFTLDVDQWLIPRLTTQKSFLLIKNIMFYGTHCNFINGQVSN